MNGSDIARNLGKQATGLVRQLLSKGLLALGQLLKQIPRAQLVLWSACALLLVVWWFEHQARLRQALELEQLQQQTATSVSKLEAQAAAAIREANERNVQAIRQLEAKRAKLEHEASDLAAQWPSLQERERAQVALLAALPPAELARRVTTLLESRGSSEAELPASSPGSSAPTPDSRLPNPALALSAPQLRTVATALVERDACREQELVRGAQIANCRAQVDTNAAIIRQQVDSLAKLNQALSAQDEIQARREIQQKAELTAARGTWISRLARAVKWVALGVVVGVVLR